MVVAGSFPRLAAVALPRRHVVDGTSFVMLHHGERDAVVQLGDREWEILAAADGTRTIEGIRERALQRGVRVSESELEAFFQQLHQVGLVELEPPEGVNTQGTPAERGESGMAALSTVGERPVVALPDYRLRCDGQGTCCRLYGTVVFSPLEVAKACAHAPDVLDAGRDHQRVFLPVDGGTSHAWAGPQKDGACAYREASGRCVLHVAAGPSAKPIGCSLFPAMFVDDGTEIRVSPMMECGCVLESRGGGDVLFDEPLVPASTTIASELPAEAFVHRLAAEVELSPRKMVARAEVLTRFDAMLDRVGALTLRAVLEWRASWLQRDVDAALPLVRAGLKRLAERARQRAQGDAVWRHDADLARLGTSRLSQAADELGAALRKPEGESMLDAELTGDEQFYWRVQLWGRQLLADQEPIGDALLSRVVRVLLSRALCPHLEEAPASVQAHPLAFVEALIRGHGYASSLRPTTVERALEGG